MKLLSILVNQFIKQILTRRLLNDSAKLNYLSQAGMFLKHRKYKTLVSSAVWKSLGHDHEPDGDSWLAYVHPDDRPFMEESWDYLDRGGSDYAQIEFRIRDLHGTYHWVLAENWVLKRNSRNQVQAYLGHDISFEGIRQFQRDFSQAAEQANLSSLDDQSMSELKGRLLAVTGYDEYWNLVLQQAWDLLDATTVWVFRFDAENGGWASAKLSNQHHSGLLEPIGFTSCPKEVQNDLTGYVEPPSSPLVRIEQTKDLPKALGRFFQLAPFEPVITGAFVSSQPGSVQQDTRNQETRGLVVYYQTKGIPLSQAEKQRIASFLQVLNQTIGQPFFKSNHLGFQSSSKFQIELFCTRLVASDQFIDDSSDQCYLLFCTVELIDGWDYSPLAQTIQKVIDESAKLLHHWVQQKAGILGTLSSIQYFFWLPKLNATMDPRLVVDLQYMLEHRSRSLGFPLAFRLVSYCLDKKLDLANQISAVVSE